jgi:hypothetical protein
MTLETLQRANAVKKIIDKLDCEKSRISKIYSKKENLSAEQIEDIIQIAMVNTDYALNRFKEELNDL